MGNGVMGTIIGEYIGPFPTKNQTAKKAEGRLQAVDLAPVAQRLLPRWSPTSVAASAAAAVPSVLLEHPS